LQKMKTRVTGLIVIGEMVCDSCGRVMKHPERYGYICEEGESPLRLCEDCSRARGYLKRRISKKEEVETFLDFQT
jgi:sulfur relay (sulfurtransferase) complex TusBCD TusD component (DsrE family)